MAEPQILVINCGSSSVRYQLRRGTTVLLSGTVDGIGGDEPRWRTQDGERELPAGMVDHRGALAAAFDAVAAQAAMPAAIGHRVVHGGTRFAAAVRIDAGVRAHIARLATLAPHHNPRNLQGIEEAGARYPGVPQIAVFDTAFHHHLPELAYRYPLPPVELAGGEAPRRYGFHGISHGAAARRAADWLRRPLEEVDLITLHLGNGASAAAIRGGHSIDTSMGFTPLEGLVMGTRCGDLDPALPLLMQEAGRSAQQVRELLEHHSGLKALCGSSEMREIHRRAAAGDSAAAFARELFAYRVKKTIGAYLAALGGAHALVFTGGIGAHDAELRRQCLHGLEGLGIVLGAERWDGAAGIGALHDPDLSRTAVLAMAADEEAEIARQVSDCLAGEGQAASAPE